ncbi:MAG TPA: acyltransferase [Novosphingobium sp.]|nr:acyltransferase [Novosphingobium sp.]
MENTIGARIANAGNTRGFDYLRIILSFGVLLWHSCYVIGDLELEKFILGSFLGTIKLLVLPMFFALSGFLVAGSLERSRTLEGFMTLRVVRLVPALAVEILLSLFVIGAIFTTLPLWEYFTNLKTLAYLWNIVGYIHFELPGVFLDNPRPPIVNVSLWTVPYELDCYLMLLGAAIFGIFRRRSIFLSLVIAASAGYWAANLYRSDFDGFTALTASGRLLVISFLAAISVYLYRDKIPLNTWLGCLSGALTLVLLSFDQTKLLCPFPAAYFTVWLGLMNPPKVPVLMDGDYSYGVYLFAYPIQQVLATAPSLRLWWVNFLLAGLLSLLYAAFSWHCVEKPILSRKKVIVGNVEQFGVMLRAGIRKAAAVLKVRSA